MGALLRLEPVGPALWDAVLALAPRDDEHRWVGRPRDMLPVADADPTRFPVAMVVDGKESTGDTDGPRGALPRPVGYLTLDWGDRSRRYAPADVIGVHGFLVDRDERRHGYATAALLALPAFVREHLPGWRAIALTVNVENPAAIGAYLGGGFTDTGELFLGGDHGPQHILTRPL